MDEKTLLLLLKITFVFLVSNIILIIGKSWYNKVRKKQLARIEMVFARQISLFLYPPSGIQPHFLQVQRALRKVGIKESKPRNIQFVIKLMIRTQRALGGENQDKLNTLYSQIPPYRASYNKLCSKNWFSKARGIREIYEMNQRKYLHEIYLLRDHPNIYVRREAQIALVIFLGWESLRFLPYHTRKISLWQQIKIVEKLHDDSKIANVQYLRKSYKTTNPWALQLILRVIKKYEIQSEIPFVTRQLQHSHYEVREAAIYCLLSLSVKAPDLKRELHSLLESIPSASQKRQMMKYLPEPEPICGSQDAVEVPASPPITAFPFKETNYGVSHFN